MFLRERLSYSKGYFSIDFLISIEIEAKGIRVSEILLKSN